MSHETISLTARCNQLVGLSLFESKKHLSVQIFAFFFCVNLFSLLQISFFSQCRVSVRTLHIYTFAILVLFIFGRCPVYMKTPVYGTQINKFLSSSSTVLNWPALSQNCGSRTDDRATDTRTCLSSPDLFPLEPIKKCIKGLPSHLICSSDCYPFKTSVYCRRV